MLHLVTPDVLHDLLEGIVPVELALAFDNHLQFPIQVE